MANSGVYPLDPTSDVGKVRLTIGDVSSVPLSPVVSGFQDYTLFSDDEITAFLSVAGDSILGAAGYAYLSLSASAALESKSIADYDLKIDLTKRATDLRATAEVYFGLAGIVPGVDYFDIVQTGTYPTSAELAEQAYTSGDTIDRPW